ncbi:MAG: hypothetical protein ABIH29_03490 [Candidatus Micrarchaeota archaeon]
MRKFSRFQISKEIAEKARQNSIPDIRSALRNGNRSNAYDIRKELTAEVLERAMAGESMGITGYPCSGKTELLADMLDRSIETGFLEGLGIILDPRGGTFGVDMNQLIAVWKLIDLGHKPRFIVLDEAGDAVPRLKNVFTGRTSQEDDFEATLILDILSKMPDRTGLVIAYPAIGHRIRHYGRSTREELCSFYGDSEKVIIPSTVSFDDFRTVISNHVARGFGQVKAGFLESVGAIERLAGYVGLYPDDISTLFLRHIVRNTEAFDKFVAWGGYNLEEALNQTNITRSFVSMVSGHLTIPLQDVCVALGILQHRDVHGEGFISELAQIREKYQVEEAEGIEASINRLNEFGIIKEGKAPNKDSLLFRAFLETRHVGLGKCVYSA